MTTPFVIAAFDFDNTITDRDSLLPFLMEFAGPAKAFLKLIQLTPAFIQFLFGSLSRQAVKEKILTSFFAGMPIEQLKRLGEQYAYNKLNQFVKPQAMERLKWHQRQGHQCVLVSASLEFYLVPWALSHGIKEVICSRLEVDYRGLITGHLIGLNCWGPEKKRRLLEKYGNRKDFHLYMYGDSQGDKELLEMADYPFYRTFSLERPANDGEDNRYS